MTDDLLSKIEQASEGGRDLDVEIAWAIGRPGSPIPGHTNEVPPYTTSLDCALTLVPEGWMVASISEFIRRGEKRSGVMLIRTADAKKELEEIANPWDALPRTEAATPALAVTAASLKACAP